MRLLIISAARAKSCRKFAIELMRIVVIAIVASLLHVSTELIVGRGPALQKSNPFDGRWTLLKENPFSVQGILRIVHTATVQLLGPSQGVHSVQSGGRIGVAAVFTTF
jgi:hypothetical protein